ncbi:MAG: lipopolysaccharide transport periplasmic protein LptA [Geobacteraceae bacterium]|nr:lipopolysaccharide transport periplasmic protein LptA [Geobacteraceae bacterium]
MRRFLTILVTILMTWVVAITGTFAAPAVRNATSNQPITIKSNELSADNKGKTAVFSGKVVAKQGDVTIFCDKMTVHYGTVHGDVEKIEADGNVRIVQGNRTGLAAHAVYDSREAKITLTGGGPKVMQGKDTVSGEVITYFIDDNRSNVSGGRVTAEIHTNSKNGARSQKGNAEQR